LPSGSALPPEIELARRWSVSRIVVRQALIDLVKDGRLYRVRGKGTFVRPRKLEYIGLLMQTDGHVYWDFFSALMQSLPAEVYGPLVINTADEFLEGLRRVEVEQRIRQLVRSHPSVIVADGKRLFPFELLAGAADREHRIIFIQRYEPPAPLTFPHQTVLPDYAGGGSLAVRHLLELGHRKILFLTSNIPDLVRWRCEYHVFAGCRSAVIERGLVPECVLPMLRYEEGTVEQQLSRLFCSRRRPTAVIAYQEYFAPVLFRVFAQLGLRVPDDVSILGIYNTPWAEIMEVPLTSVSFRPHQRAAETIRLIKDPGLREQHILVSPELVVRRSCGTVPTLKGGAA